MGVGCDDLMENINDCCGEGVSSIFGAEIFWWIEGVELGWGLVVLCIDKIYQKSNLANSNSKDQLGNLN